jgi:NtrC-family two-component system sensor histidine kinase KinB
MPIRHLQTRFILVGCLLVATTVGTGLWGALTFARLGATARDALRDSQATIDLADELAESLEREDDALLLALSGATGSAREALASERRHGDECLARLETALGEGQQGATGRAVAGEIRAYRSAGTALVESSSKPDALARYHKEVNPLLRQAVASCASLREAAVDALRAAGTRASDEAGRATVAVAALSAVALVLAAAAAFWLARSVVPPVRALTEAVDAVREGDFDRRVVATSTDELGHLAAGFNRMAESLGEYRQSSLGELLTAKITLEETLNALPEAVLVVAPDGSLVALNPPARAVLGSLRASEATRIGDVPLRQDHRAAVDAALAGHPPGPHRADFGQTLVVTVGGQPRQFLLTAVPIPEFLPHRCGAAVVLDDVTEFARLDELRSELIGVASHELKTPLTSLKLSLSLLSEDSDGTAPRQREMLDEAMRGCEELGSTIDELLDVTRIEAGQLRLDLGPVDLTAVARSAADGLRRRFASAGVQLDVTHDGPPATIRGDAVRLGSVVTNLLTNALKYSPRGGRVSVRVSSHPSAPGSTASVEAAVTDSGPGVPSEFRERIFEKFFRVEHQRPADSHAVRGTGIGLYLCREIVKAHGGSIRCEAGEGGVGARVALTVPASGNE